MKSQVFILFILLSFPLVAQDKKDIVLQTDISEVTVFIKGAQVVRKTTAALPAGKSTVRFVNLSPYIDVKSMQVKAEGEVMILSVSHQLNYNDTIKQAEDIERQLKQIAGLNEKLVMEKASKEIIHEELTFLHENKKIGGTEGINFGNLKETSLYYGERIASLKMKEIEIDKRIRNLEDEKSGIERKLVLAGNVKPEPASEVLLTVDCRTAARIPVELSYYVNNAGWYPSYDIRAKNISEPVGLLYKANIMQNTKEDWKNVRLKVSSVNPNLGNVAPKLKTYFLNYHTQPPRYDGNDLSNQVRGKVTDTSGESLAGVSILIKGSTIGTTSDIDGNFSLSIPSGGGELFFSYIGMNSRTLPISTGFMNVVLEENQATLDEVVVVGYGVAKTDLVGRLAGAVKGITTKTSSRKEVFNHLEQIPLPVAQIENQTSVEFEIKTPYTVLSESKNTIVEIEHYSLPADYEYYCVPKADKDAFLLAYVSDWEQYNLLEGEANIFFENTFVGKTIIDVRYMSDTLNISLGRDKNVVVQREKLKEYTTQKFLGNKIETNRAWKISVRNNKRQPVSMILFDQIPVSTMKEIEVDAETISGGVLNDETGEIKWKFTLQPSQKNELNLKYKIKYPKGRVLAVE